MSKEMNNDGDDDNHIEMMMALVMVNEWCRRKDPRVLEFFEFGKEDKVHLRTGH